MNERERVAEIMPESKREKKSSRARKVEFAQSSGSPADRVLSLQRTIGNKAVERLISSGTLQTKLRIGQPDDIYEQEADRVADAVMRMPEPEILSRNELHIQRSCPACDENELKRQSINEEEEEKLQAKKTSDRAPEIDPNIESHIQSLNGEGQPLSEDSRAFFEPRFGHDFSQVRVHTDTKAAEAARAVNARAYTVGHDVVFGEGQFRPASFEGKKLMAHELTHVVQQGNYPKLIHRLIRTPYPWRGIITPAIGANIRSSPDLSNPANIIDAIPRGQTVTVISNTGNWLQVESRYRGPVTTGYIFNTLVDDATSLSMEGSVGTTMVWRPSGPGSGTDFESWASAATETPFPPVTSTTVMNCWEAVLLSAYRSGSISWTWIHNMYVSVSPSNWVSTMTRGARHTYAVPGPNLRMPQRGDLVFFDGLAHVALATGSGSNVYTFWPPPNTPFTAGGTTDKVKVFSIEQLVDWWGKNMPPQPVVEFGAPSW